MCTKNHQSFLNPLEIGANEIDFKCDVKGKITTVMLMMVIDDEDDEELKEQEEKPQSYKRSPAAQTNSSDLGHQWVIHRSPIGHPWVTCLGQPWVTYTVICLPSSSSPSSILPAKKLPHMVVVPQ